MIGWGVSDPVARQLIHSLGSVTRAVAFVQAMHQLAAETLYVYDDLVVVGTRLLGRGYTPEEATAMLRTVLCQPSSAREAHAALGALTSGALAHGGG